MLRGIARISTAVAVLLGVAGFVPSSVSAVRSSTGISIDEPVRIFDSRYDGPDWVVVDGVERANPAAAGALVNVILAGGLSESWLYFHPCGTPPDRSQPAAVQSAVGRQAANLVPVRAGETCMTRYGVSHVVIDQIGREGVSGGLNYVAHDEPTDLEVVMASPGARVQVLDADTPPDTEAVAVWVTVASPENGAGGIVASTCDGSQESIALWVVPDMGETAGNLMLLTPESNGEICFGVIGSMPAAISVRRWGYLSATAAPTAEGLPYSGFVSQTMPGFTALSPTRLFDTRDSGMRLKAGAVYSYTFEGLPDGATAVALNITATATGAAGHVSAFPCGGDPPLVSNLNYPGPGETVPNFAIVSLSPEHEVCFTSHAETHLLADLAGYYAFDTGEGYWPMTPQRIFDSRTFGGLLAGSGSVTIPFGVNPIPGTPTVRRASAAVLNVTVTQPQGNGHLTVYPCGTTPPLASNLNFRAGETRANLVTVKLPETGDAQVCFVAPVQLNVVIDQVGLYAPWSEVGLLDFEPYRLFDTRDEGQPLTAADVYASTVGSSDVVAVAWNVTVTQPQGPGHITMYPCAPQVPNTSVLNYSAGQTIANFAIVQPNSARELCFVSHATSHLIADESGVFTKPLPWEVYYEGAPNDQPATAAADARDAFSAIWSSTSSVWATPTNSAS